MFIVVHVFRLLPFYIIIDASQYCSPHAILILSRVTRRVYGIADPPSKHAAFSKPHVDVIGDICVIYHARHQNHLQAAPQISCGHTSKITITFTYEPPQIFTRPLSSTARMTDQTFHNTVSKSNDGNVPADSEPSLTKVCVPSFPTPRLHPNSF